MTLRRWAHGPLLVTLACALASACTGENTSGTKTADKDQGVAGSGGGGGTAPVGGGTAGSGGGGAGGAMSTACERAPDCDVVPATAGFLCDNGTCRPCASDRECQRIPHYGEATSCIDGQCLLPDPCETMRGAGCGCDEQRACTEGLVCDAGGKCAADPCTLPGAVGSQGCPCPAAPVACQAGLQCAADTMVCTACAGEAGCPCPCDDGLTCGADGRCAGSACATPGAADCACRPDGSCDEGLFCDGTACRACEGGQVTGCPCVAGACRGLVCDAGACRDALDCDDLARNGVCGDHRACVPGASPERDATCGACELGFVEQGGACVRDMAHLPTCQPGAPDDISVACEQRDHRDCGIGADGAAVCTACLDGYIEVGGSCELQRDCNDAGCAMANRICDPPAPGRHAVCLGCLGGYEVPPGCAGPECACEAIQGLTCQEIVPPCSDTHQSCDDSDGSAECTGCEPGYVFDAAVGACRLRETCESLACDADLHRPCIRGIGGPDDRCDFEACAPGYVSGPAGSEACVAEVSCDSTPCAEGEFCRIENNRAICDSTPCRAGEAYDSASRTCFGCSIDLCPPDEARTGNVAPYQVGGNCICETRNGFFWRTGNGADAIACDEDGDGWMSQSAWAATRSPDAHLAEQARCDVRRVDRFILRPEQGADIVLSTQAEFGAPFVPLVETDRNDRQGEFERSAPADHPSYFNPPALGGRQLRVEEVNPLTKFCVDERADFNDDGLPDVAQAQNSAPGNRLQDAVANAVAVRLAYFAELHTAAYVAPGVGQAYGAYVVAERSRLMGGSESESVAFTPGPAAGEYWRECHRFQDAGAVAVRNGEPKTGFDFTQYYDVARREGMVHHSQFKCLDVVRPDRPELLGASERLHMVSSDVAAQRYGFQGCQAGLDGFGVVEGGLPVNPWNVAFHCDPLPADDRSFQLDGFVAWAVVPYAPYGGEPTVRCADENGNDDDRRCSAGISCIDGYCQDPELVRPYTRGCVNECAELDWLVGYDGDYVASACPQYRGGVDPRFACGVAPYSPEGGAPAVPDSGRLVCGCALSYGGEACSIGCGSAGIDGDVLVSSDFNLATRDGDWMCASFSAADSEPVVDAAGEYSLSGRVSLSPVSRGEAQSGQAVDGTTFSVY